MSKKISYPEHKVRFGVKIFALAVILFLLTEGIVFLLRPVHAQQDYSFFYDDFNDKELSQWHGGHRILSFTENDDMLSVEDGQVAYSIPINIIWGGKTEVHLRIKNVNKNFLSTNTRLEIIDYNTSKVLYTLIQSDFKNMADEEDYDLSMFVFEDTKEIVVQITGKLRIGEIEIYSPEVYYLDLLKSDFIDSQISVWGNERTIESETFVVPYAFEPTITVTGYLPDTTSPLREVELTLKVYDFNTEDTYTLAFDYVNITYGKQLAYMSANLELYMGHTMRLIIVAKENEEAALEYNNSVTINFLSVTLEKHNFVTTQSRIIDPINYIKRDSNTFVDTSKYGEPVIGKDRDGYYASYKIENKEVLFTDSFYDNHSAEYFVSETGTWEEDYLTFQAQGYAYRKNVDVAEFEISTMFSFNDSNIVAGIGIYGTIYYEFAVGNITTGKDAYDEDIYNATLLVYQNGKVVENIPLKDQYLDNSPILMSVESVSGLRSYKVTINGHEYFIKNDKVAGLYGHPGVFVKSLDASRDATTSFTELNVYSKPNTTNYRLLLKADVTQPTKIIVYRTLENYDTKKPYLAKIGEDIITPDEREIAIFKYSPLMEDYIHIFIEGSDQPLKTPFYLTGMMISGVLPMNIMRPAFDYYAINPEAKIKPTHIEVTGAETDTKYIASYDFHINAPGLIKIQAETQEDYPNTKIDVYMRKLNSGDIFEYKGTIYWTEHFTKRYTIHSLYVNVPEGDYEIRLEKPSDMATKTINIAQIGVYTLSQFADAVEDASGFNTKEEAWGTDFVNTENNDYVEDGIFHEKVGYTLVNPTVTYEDTDDDGVKETITDYIIADEQTVIKQAENNLAGIKGTVRLSLSEDILSYPFLKFYARTLSEHYSPLGGNVALRLQFYFEDVIDGTTQHLLKSVDITVEDMNCTYQFFSVDVKKLAKYDTTTYLRYLKYIEISTGDFTILKNIRVYNIYSDDTQLQFDTESHSGYDAPFISNYPLDFNIQDNFIPYYEGYDTPVTIYTKHSAYDMLIDSSKPEFTTNPDDRPLFPDYLHINYEGEYSWLADPGENVPVYTTCLTNQRIYFKLDSSILNITQDKDIGFDSVDGLPILQFEIKPYPNVYDDTTGMIQYMKLIIEFHPYNQSLTDYLGFLTFKFTFDSNAQIGSNIKDIDSLSDTLPSIYHDKLYLKDWQEPFEDYWYNNNNYIMKYGRLNVTADDIIALGTEFGQTTRLIDSYEDDTGDIAEQQRIDDQEKKFLMYVFKEEDKKNLLFYSDNDMPSFAKTYLSIYPINVRFSIDWKVSTIPHWYENMFASGKAIQPQLLQADNIRLYNYPIKFNVHDIQYNADNYGEYLYLFDEMTLIRPLEDLKVVYSQIDSPDFLMGTFKLVDSQNNVFHSHFRNRYNSSTIYFNLDSSQSANAYELYVNKDPEEHYNFLDSSYVATIDTITLKTYKQYTSHFYSFSGGESVGSTDWLVGNKLWRVGEDNSYDRLKTLSGFPGLTVFEGPDGLSYLLQQPVPDVEQVINPYNRDTNDNGIPDMLENEPHFYFPGVYQTNMPEELSKFYDYEYEWGGNLLAYHGAQLAFYNASLDPNNNDICPTFTTGLPTSTYGSIDVDDPLNNIRYNAPFIFEYPAFMNSFYPAKTKNVYRDTNNANTPNYVGDMVGNRLAEFVLPDNYNPLPVTFNPALLPEEFIFDIDLNIQPWSVKELEDEGFFRPVLTDDETPQLAFYKTIPIFLPTHSGYPKVLRFIVYYDSGSYYKEQLKGTRFDTPDYHPYYQVYVGRRRLGTFLNTFNLQMHLRVEIKKKSKNSNYYSYCFLLTHNGAENIYDAPEPDGQQFTNVRIGGELYDETHDFNYYHGTTETWEQRRDNLPDVTLWKLDEDKDSDEYTHTETYKETNLIKFEPEVYLSSKIYTHTFHNLAHNTLGFGINYKYITLKNAEITPLQQPDKNVQPIGIESYTDKSYSYDDENILVYPNKYIYIDRWLNKQINDNFGVEFKWRVLKTTTDIVTTNFFLNGTNHRIRFEIKFNDDSMHITVGNWSDITQSYTNTPSQVIQYFGEHFDITTSFKTFISYNNKNIEMWVWEEGKNKNDGAYISYGGNNLSLERVKFTIRNKDNIYFELYTIDTTAIHCKDVDFSEVYYGEGHLGSYYLHYNSTYALQLSGEITLTKELTKGEIINPQYLNIAFNTHEETETYISIIGYNNTNEQYTISSVKITGKDIYSISNTTELIYNNYVGEVPLYQWTALTLTGSTMMGDNNNTMYFQHVRLFSETGIVYQTDINPTNFEHYVLKIENKGYKILIDDIEWGTAGLYVNMNTQNINQFTIDQKDGYYEFVDKFDNDIRLNIFGDGDCEVTVTINDEISKTTQWYKSGEQIDITAHPYIFHTEEINLNEPIKVDLYITGIATIKSITIVQDTYPESFLYVPRLTDYLNSEYGQIKEVGIAQEVYDEELYNNVLEISQTTNIKLTAYTNTKNFVLEGAIKGQGNIIIDNQIEIINIIENAIYPVKLVLRAGIQQQKDVGTVTEQNGVKVFTIDITSIDEKDEWTYFSVDLLNILLHTNYVTGEIDLTQRLEQIENNYYGIKQLKLNDNMLTLTCGPGQDNLYLTDIHLFKPTNLIDSPYEGKIVENIEEILADQHAEIDVMKWVKGKVGNGGKINLEQLYIHQNLTTGFATYDLVMFLSSSLLSETVITITTGGIFTLYAGNIIVGKKDHVGIEEKSLFFTAPTETTVLTLHITFPIIFSPKNVEIKYYNSRNDAYISGDNPQTTREWLASTPISSKQTIDPAFLEFISRSTVLETDSITMGNDTLMFDKIEMNEIGMLTLYDTYNPPTINERVILTTNFIYDRNLDNTTLYLAPSDDMNIEYVIYDGIPLIINDLVKYEEISKDENGTVTIPINTKGLTKRFQSNDLYRDTFEMRDVKYIITPFDNPDEQYDFKERKDFIPDFNLTTSQDNYRAFMPAEKTFINTQGIHSIVIVVKVTQTPKELTLVSLFTPLTKRIRTILKPEQYNIDLTKTFDRNVIKFSNRLPLYEDYYKEQTITQIPLNAYNTFRGKFFTDALGNIHYYRIYYAGLSGMQIMDSGKYWKELNTGVVHKEDDERINWLFVSFQMNFMLVIDQNTNQQTIQPFSLLIGRLLFYDWVASKDYGEALKEPKLYTNRAVPCSNKKGDPLEIEGFDDELTVTDIQTEIDSEGNVKSQATTYTSSNGVKWIINTEPENNTLTLSIDEQPTISGISIDDTGLAKDLTVTNDLYQNGYKFNFAWYNLQKHIQEQLSGNEKIILNFDFADIKISCLKTMSAGQQMFIQENNTTTNNLIEFYYDNQYDTLVVPNSDLNSKMTVFTQRDKYLIMDMQGVNNAIEGGYNDVYLNNTFMNNLKVETASAYGMSPNELYNRVATNILSAFKLASLSIKNIQLGGLDLPTDTLSLLILYDVFVDLSDGVKEALGQNLPTGTVDFAHFIIDIIDFETKLFLKEILYKDSYCQTVIRWALAIWKGLKNFGKALWKMTKNQFKVLDVAESEDTRDDIYHLTNADYLRFHYWLIRWWAIVVGTARGIRAKDPYFTNSERTGLTIDIGTMYQYIEKHFTDKAISNLQKMNIISRDVDESDEPSEYLPLVSKEYMNEIIYHASLNKDGYKLIDWLTSEKYQPEYYKMNEKDAKFYYFWKLMSLQYGPYAIKVYTFEEATDPDHEDFDDNYLVIAVPVSTDGITVDYKWYVSLDKNMYTPTPTKSKAFSGLLYFIKSFFTTAFAPATVTVTGLDLYNIFKAAAMINKAKYWTKRVLSEFEFIQIIELIMNVIPGVDIYCDVRDAIRGEDAFTRNMGIFQTIIDTISLLSIVGKAVGPIKSLFESIQSLIKIGKIAKTAEEAIDAIDTAAYIVKTEEIIETASDAFKLADEGSAVAKIATKLAEIEADTTTEFLSILKKAGKEIAKEIAEKTAEKTLRQKLLGAGLRTFAWLMNVEYEKGIVGYTKLFVVTVVNLIFFPQYLLTKIRGVPFEISLKIVNTIVNNFFIQLGQLANKTVFRGLVKKWSKDGANVAERLIAYFTDLINISKGLQIAQLLYLTIYNRYSRLLNVAYMFAYMLEEDEDNRSQAKLLPNINDTDKELEWKPRDIMSKFNNFLLKVSGFDIFLRIQAINRLAETENDKITEQLKKAGEFAEMMFLGDADKLAELESKTLNPENTLGIILGIMEKIGNTNFELKDKNGNILAQIKGSETRLYQEVLNGILTYSNSGIYKEFLSYIGFLARLETYAMGLTAIRMELEEKGTQDIDKVMEEKIAELSDRYGLGPASQTVKFNEKKKTYEVDYNEVLGQFATDAIYKKSDLKNVYLHAGSDLHLRDMIANARYEFKTYAINQNDYRTGSGTATIPKYVVYDETGKEIDKGEDIIEYLNHLDGDEVWNDLWMHAQFGLLYAMIAAKADLAKPGHKNEPFEQKQAILSSFLQSTQIGLKTDMMIFHVEKEIGIEENNQPHIKIDNRKVPVAGGIGFEVKINPNLATEGSKYYFVDSVGRASYGQFRSLVIEIKYNEESESYELGKIYEVSDKTSIIEGKISQKDIWYRVVRRTTKTIDLYVPSITVKENGEIIFNAREPLFNFAIRNEENKIKLLQFPTGVTSISAYSLFVPTIMKINGEYKFVLTLLDQNNKPIVLKNDKGKEYRIYIDILKMFGNELSKESFIKFIKKFESLSAEDQEKIEQNNILFDPQKFVEIISSESPDTTKLENDINEIFGYRDENGNIIEPIAITTEDGKIIRDNEFRRTINIATQQFVQMLVAKKVTMLTETITIPKTEMGEEPKIMTLAATYQMFIKNVKKISIEKTSIQELIRTLEEADTATKAEIIYSIFMYQPNYNEKIRALVKEHEGKTIKEMVSAIEANLKGDKTYLEYAQEILNNIKEHIEQQIQAPEIVYKNSNGENVEYIDLAYVQNLVVTETDTISSTVPNPNDFIDKNYLTTIEKLTNLPKGYNEVTGNLLLYIKLIGTTITDIRQNTLVLYQTQHNTQGILGTSITGQDMLNLRKTSWDYLNKDILMNVRKEFAESVIKRTLEIIRDKRFNKDLFLYKKGDKAKKELANVLTKQKYTLITQEKAEEVAEKIWNEIESKLKDPSNQESNTINIAKILGRTIRINYDTNQNLEQLVLKLAYHQALQEVQEESQYIGYHHTGYTLLFFNPQKININLFRISRNSRKNEYFLQFPAILAKKLFTENILKLPKVQDTTDTSTEKNEENVSKFDGRFFNLIENVLENYYNTIVSKKDENFILNKEDNAKVLKEFTEKIINYIKHELEDNNNFKETTNGGGRETEGARQLKIPINSETIENMFTNVVPSDDNNKPIFNAFQYMEQVIETLTEITSKLLSGATINPEDIKKLEKEDRDDLKSLLFHNIGSELIQTKNNILTSELIITTKGSSTEIEKVIITNYQEEKIEKQKTIKEVIDKTSALSALFEKQKVLQYKENEEDKTKKTIYADELGERGIILKIDSQYKEKSFAFIYSYTPRIPIITKYSLATYCFKHPQLLDAKIQATFDSNGKVSIPLDTLTDNFLYQNLDVIFDGYYGINILYSLLIGEKLKNTLFKQYSANDFFEEYIQDRKSSVVSEPRMEGILKLFIFWNNIFNAYGKKSSTDTNA